MSRGRVWVLLLGVYFGLQILLRWWASDTVELDESEQVLLAQLWNWGYGAQPPLYTWLQIIAFELIGTNVIALAVLKNLLLAITYIFTYLNGRLLTRDAWGGILAAVSLLYVPQVVWESQRDLTHSVLATTLAAITLFSFLRLIQTKQTRFFLLLGLCTGLGLLAKYNYVLLFIGLVAGALVDRQARSVILSVRFFLTILLIGIVIGPHLAWVLTHSDQALSAAVKLTGEERAGYFSSVSDGLGDLMVAVVVFLGPMALVYLAAFQRDFSSVWRERFSPEELLIARQIAIILGGLLIGVFVFQWTNFRDRWFLPILIGAPVLLASRLQTRVTTARLRVLGGIALAVVAALLFLVPGRVLLAHLLGGPNRLTAPYSQLARAMKLPPGDLICENRWIGGNLRLAFPERTIVVPELGVLWGRARRPAAVVWDFDENPLPPSPLVELVGVMSSGRGRISAPVVVQAAHYHCPTVKMRLAWAEVLTPDGAP